MYQDFFYKYYGKGLVTDPLWDYINKRNEQIKDDSSKKTSQKSTEAQES